jgi:hypothetical protein
MKHGFLKVLFVVLGLDLSFVIALKSEEPAPAPPAVDKAKEEATPQPPPPVAKPKEETPPQLPSPPRRKFMNLLPIMGAPASRVDGGSRGSGVSLTCVTVLAPDSTASTVQEQPSLFWYQSQPADVRFELTILVQNTVRPLLQVQFPDARKAGIQRLNLADHDVKLAPGVEYEWVVALVVDSESRSKDVIASGWIKRVEPSASLKSQLDNATRENLPFVYAGEGIWLDTLTAISDLIDVRPKDRSLQEGRAALLAQVGLTNAAVYVASQAPNDGE